MVEGWELGPKSRHGELGLNTTVGFRRLLIEEICRCLFVSRNETINYIVSAQERTSVLRHA